MESRDSRLMPTSRTNALAVANTVPQHRQKIGNDTVRETGFGEGKRGRIGQTIFDLLLELREAREEDFIRTFG